MNNPTLPAILFTAIEKRIPTDVLDYDKLIEDIEHDTDN